MKIFGGKFFILLAICIALLSLVACGQSSSTLPTTPPVIPTNTTPVTATTPVNVTTPSKTLDLRVQHDMKAPTKMWEYGLKFAEQVAKDSNGSLKLDVYPEGQLVSTADMPTALPAGTVDMGISQITLGWPTLVPDVNIVNGVGVFSSFDQARRFQFGEFGDIIKDKFLKKNVKIIGFLYNGPTDTMMNSKKLIKLPADMAGIKFRVPNAPSTAAVEAVGASGVIISPAEVYQAIQRGTVDGIFGTIPQIDQSFSLHEVAKYWTRMPIQEGYRYAVTVNLDVWNKLTTEQQNVLTKAAQDYEKNCTPLIADEFNQAWNSIKSFSGVEVYNVPAEDVAKFNALMIPATKKFLEEKIPAADLANYLALIEKAK